MEQKLPDLISLEGKVAVISGGASGIGLGTAKKLAEYGAKIMLLDINEDGGAEAAKAIEEKGGTARFLKCDVRLPEDCKNAADTTSKIYGRIDILFNNAGIAIRKDAIDLEPEE